jgi:hypothetical protein
MGDPDFSLPTVGSVNPGYVVYVPGGSALETWIARYAGTGAVLMLKGNTYGTSSEYTLNWTNLAPGTFVGGVTVMGPTPSTRKTYLGTAGSNTSAQQMTQAQLAGKMASIKVTGGPTTSQNYAAGSVGWGVDGLCFDDVFSHGETMPANQSLFVDTSANVTSRGAEFVDFTGGLVTYLYRFTDNGSILAASSGGYTVLMGIFNATYYTALGCPIHDYLNNNHFYIGSNGPAPVNAGQYEDYFVSGGIQFNPSGLYTMDVGFDFEYGSKLGLRSFTADWVVGTNLKPVGYLSKSGKVRIGQIDHRITRGYATSPGSAPSGAPFVLSSANYSDPNGFPMMSSTDVEIGTINVVQEANSNPAYNTNGLIDLSTYSYLGNWHVGTLRAIVNLAGNGGPSGSGSALMRVKSSETSLLAALIAGGGATGPSYTFTTPNNGCSLFYQLTGGTVSGITVNGSGVGTTLNQVIGPNIVVVITYSSTSGMLFQTSSAATTAFFESFVIDNFYIGVTIAGNPSTAVPTISLANSSTLFAKTAGRFTVGNLKYMVGGPAPITWAPTTAVAFTVPVEGTYTGTGGTITGYTVNAETPVVATSFALHLQAGEKITTTFTGSPTFNLYQGNGEFCYAGDGTHALHSAEYSFGITGCTMTLSDEETLRVDASEMAANAVTAKRPAPAGTWTTTRRKVHAWSPADAADTVTIGTSVFTYTHGVTPLVTKGLPADGPGTIGIIKSAGTITNISYNGAQFWAVAPVANDSASFDVEMQDTIAVTWATTAPTSVIVGKRRLGS